MGIYFDKNLSLKAQGLYSIISDLLQHHCNVSIAEIQNHCGDGKDSIRSAMNELTTKGYLKKEQLKDGNGFFGLCKYTLLK